MHRVECDTVSGYFTYYLSGMFWREMGLTRHSQQPFSCVRAHGPGSCVKKKITYGGTSDFWLHATEYFKNPKFQNGPITGL